MIEEAEKMAKAYWVATYRAIKDPAAMAAYAKISRPVLEAAGGRVLARSIPSVVFELGLAERVVLIEFDSVESAKAAYESSGYQAARKLLGDDAVERDIRIVEADI